MKKQIIPKKIIISRTDNIGDVVLTLPLAGIIKNKYPNCEILFLGKTYTQSIINSSIYIDQFINWDILRNDSNPKVALQKYNADAIICVFPDKNVTKLAFKAKIPIRIGTYGRFQSMLFCNRRVVFSRKNSDLHESQLNTKLLAPLGIKRYFTLNDIEKFYGFSKIKPLPNNLMSLLEKTKTNIILHPKSNGSAKEWGVDKFAELVDLLPEDKFKIFITGSEKEGKLIGKEITNNNNVVSLIGKLTLDEMISFISNVSAFVSSSTGPLHIAAATGIKAIGLFSPKRPLHPGRWKPIGKNAIAIVKDENCPKCLAGESCNCITLISPKTIMDELISVQKKM
jgi:ADP-heptose:LPS heptosyltransferase